jgi:arylsulfatase A-like enzyme
VFIQFRLKGYNWNMQRKLTLQELAARPFLILAGLLPLAGCVENDPVITAEEVQPPDVVVFLVDTLRADWTGPGGFDKDTTPNLSRLAEESVVFDQASAAAPWTLPSVVSLFTGKHMAEHNVVHDRLHMADATVTFPQLLQEWGYQTVSFHRNPYAGGKWGLKRGFDQATLTQRQTGKPQLAEFFASITPMPFLLYVHNTEPHDPHVVRKKFMQSFDPVPAEFLKEYGELVDVYRRSTREDFVKKNPLGTIDNTELQEQWIRRLNRRKEEIQNLYSVSVRDADDHLGSVIEALKEEGRWENTLFIMLADHGEELGDHGGWQHDQSAYEELIHVPLIVRFPQNEHAGQRIFQPVSLVDVMPTILEAVGCPLDQPPMSGRSLLPLIRGEGDSGMNMRVVSIRNNMKKYFKPYKEGRGDLNVVVRNGDMKAIFNVEPGTVELYDLKSDPGEAQDLAQVRNEEADEFGRFAARSYAEMLKHSDHAQAGDLNEQSAEVLKALEALGYLGGESAPPDAPK